MRFINPILMWVVVIIGAVGIWFTIPYRQTIVPNLLTASMFIGACLAWMYLVYLGLKTHPEAPRGVRSITELKTTGPFAVVRHPLYAAHICFAWSFLFILTSARTFLIVVWLTLVLLLWAKLEEFGLVKIFGTAYVRYRERTPMFIPRIG